MAETQNSKMHLIKESEVKTSKGKDCYTVYINYLQKHSTQMIFYCAEKD